MTYTPDYTIHGDKPIHLLFNTYAFKKYSEKRGLEFDGLFKELDNAGLKSSALPDLLAAANESYCKYNGEPYTATELDVCMWVDQLGGFMDEKVVSLYLKYVSKLTNIDISKLEAKLEEVQDEKKSMNQPPGAGSTDAQPKRVSNRLKQTV